MPPSGRKQPKGRARSSNFPQIAGKRLHEHRSESGFTQERLAVAMQRVGHPRWTRVTCAEVETDRRKFSLSELLALATLFSVPMVEFCSPTSGSTWRIPSSDRWKKPVVEAVMVGPSDGPDWAPALQTA